MFFNIYWFFYFQIEKMRLIFLKNFKIRISLFHFCFLSKQKIHRILSVKLSNFTSSSQINYSVPFDPNLGDEILFWEIVSYAFHGRDNYTTYMVISSEHSRGNARNACVVLASER